MTKIIVLHDDQEVDEFDFAADVSRISIGRRPANDVCLADRSVSGAHAQLLVDESALVIEDLSSTNGTYVNGRAVNSHMLVEGDDLLIGKVRLRIEALASINARPAPVVSSGYAPVEPHRHDHEIDRDDHPADRDLRPDASLLADLVDDDDDELNESMRIALSLYSEDPVDEFSSSTPAFVDEDDDLDFSEDARLFAQRPGTVQRPSEAALSSLENDIDDDRLPEAIDDPPVSAEPQTLSDRAKAALEHDSSRPRLHAVPSDSVVADRSATASEPPRDHASAATRVAVAEHASDAVVREPAPSAHPLDDLPEELAGPAQETDRPRQRSRGAMIEIKNGAKAGQILPIDKPVTTLGRPGIQIAAIMRKPDGYFLMHIESDDSVAPPTLNADAIGDEPVLLHSGDALNVAGIDVEFLLS